MGQAKMQKAYPVYVKWQVLVTIKADGAVPLITVIGYAAWKNFDRKANCLNKNLFYVWMK